MSTIILDSESNETGVIARNGFATVKSNEPELSDSHIAEVGRMLRRRIGRYLEKAYRESSDRTTARFHYEGKLVFDAVIQNESIRRPLSADSVRTILMNDYLQQAGI